MDVLAFAASLRKNSHNRKLINLAAQIAQAEGANVDLVDFRDFTMPIYDGDIDAQEGPPLGALKLAARIRAADALLISTPEYNFSIAGPLKNAIDWVSRIRPMPWRGKSVYLMSASPSAMGGIRGLWQTRIPLEGCGSLVFPDMFALAHADKAFDESGRIKEETMAKRLQTELAGFIRMADALANICGDQAPVEFRQQRLIIAEALEEQTELQGPP